MKYLIVTIVAFLLGTCLGIYLVDDTFSEHERYLAWDYDYVQELEAQKRCLYYWYPSGRSGSHSGRKLVCLPKEYPL